MSEASNTDREIQIHVHEHVAPIRERMSKLEGRIESHERELTLLRQSLDALRDRIDSAREDMLGCLDKHHADIIETFRRHEAIDHDKDDEISRKVGKVADAQALCAERLAGMKAWMVGIGLGMGALIGAVQFFWKIHGGG